MRVTVDGVTVALAGVTVLDGADLVVQPGEFVGVVGPNGSGKSTLLRAIYRAVRPVSGLVTVAGDDVWRLSPREAAQRVAVVVQEGSSDFDLTVHEVVQLGRNPHKGPFAKQTQADDEICREALARVGMATNAHRSFGGLSGGEKQRVLVARALAQQGQVLVLDEPTNHLDIRYQLELLRFVRELGSTVIVAMHDLNLAASYCDRLYLLDHGMVIAAGHPDHVLTPDLVARVFGVRLRRWPDPDTGRTHFSFDPFDAGSTAVRGRSLDAVRDG